MRGVTTGEGGLTWRERPLGDGFSEENFDLGKTNDRIT